MCKSIVKPQNINVSISVANTQDRPHQQLNRDTIIASLQTFKIIRNKYTYHRRTIPIPKPQPYVITQRQMNMKEDDF